MPAQRRGAASVALGRTVSQSALGDAIIFKFTLAVDTRAARVHHAADADPIADLVLFDL
jgi:hypothetical protein